MNNDSSSISVVATVYNSCEIIDELVNRISNALYGKFGQYEIILVDDGSSDDSHRTIERICAHNKRVKGLILEVNVGQQLAMSSGIRYSSGDVIAILDGDLQNPPEEIPNMINKLGDNGVVLAVSKKRDGLVNKWTSIIFWKSLNFLSDTKYIPNQLMLRVFTKQVADQFNLYDERKRTVANVFHQISRIAVVHEVVNEKRYSGRSGYTFFKRLNIGLDFIFESSTKPLEYIMNFGLIVGASSFLYLLFLSINYFRIDTIPSGFTTVASLVTLFGGILVALLGLISRYIANIYLEVKKRPLWHLKEKINF